ncbi:MAG: T9SS type A sorting domain-containing protein [Bacteroidota bacterium]
MKRTLVPLWGIVFAIVLLWSQGARAQCTAPSIKINNVVTTGTVTICSGSSLTMTSSFVPSGGTVKNLWSTGDETNSITVTTAGTYFLRTADPGTCTSGAGPTVTVVVQSPPLPAIAKALGNTNLCVGESVTLTAPGGYAFYKWSNNATTATISVSTAGKYSVQVANLAGCWSDTAGGYTRAGLTFYPNGATAEDSIYITTNTSGICSSLANAVPGVDSMWHHGGVKINGQSWQNVVAANNGDTRPQTAYQNSNGVFTKTIKPRTYWNISGSFATASITELDFVLGGGAVNGGWFTKDGKDGANGCGDYFVPLPIQKQSGTPKQAVTVTVKSAVTTPVASVSSGNNPFCEGGSLVLTSNNASGNLWSTGATTQTLTVSAAGTYTVRTISNGCTSSNSNSIVVTMTPRAAKPTISADGPTTFCTGGSVVLTSSATSGNLWSNGATTQSITVSTAGSYSVAVIASGCTSNTSDITSVAVTANGEPGPAVTAGGPTTFCQGGSVTLTAPAGYTYMWSNAATTQSITVSTAGDYSVQVMSGSCTSAFGAATTVTVNTLPNAPTATITSGTATTCGNAGATLTSSSATGNIWSNGATTQSITVATTGSYTVRYYNGTCTSAASAPVAITVNTKPEPQIPYNSTGVTTICTGQSVTLTAPAGYNFYKWSPTNETTQTISATASGHYAVQVAFANDCWSDTGVSKITSNVILFSKGNGPDDSLTIVVDATKLCQQGDGILSTAQLRHYGGARVNGSQWSYVVDAGSNDVKSRYTKLPNGLWVKKMVPRTYFTGAPTNQSMDQLNMLLVGGPISNVFAGSGRNISGCGDIHADMPLAGTGLTRPGIDLTVKPVVTTPTISVSSGSNPICQGSTLVLTGPSGSGISWLWSTGATTQTLSLSAAATVTLRTIFDGCTSSTSSPMVVTVNNKPGKPTISADGPLTFCDNGSVTLTSSAGAAYLWSTGATTQSITVSDEASYSVQIIANGCTSDVSDETDVAVTSNSVAPTITAGGPLSFCQNGSVTLTGPGGYSSYMWSNGASTRSTTITTSQSVTLVVATPGCTSATSNAVNVSVTPLPATPTVSITSGSTTLCYPQTVTLHSSSSTGNLWSNGATTQDITVSAAGSFSVRVIGSGCTSLTSAVTAVSLYYKPLPAKITALTPTEVCAGTQVTLSAPAGFPHYLWSNGETTRNITVTAGANYTVQVGNAAGCWSDTGRGWIQGGMTIYPYGATADDSVLLVVNTGNICGSLALGSPVRMHSGVSTWNYVVTADAAADKAVFTNTGTAQWSKRIVPRSYYGLPSDYGVNNLSMVLVSGSPSGGWWQFDGKDNTGGGCGDFFLPMPVQQNNGSAFGYSSMLVKVNPVPAKPVISVFSGNNPLCQGQTMVLTAPDISGATYIWNTGATTRAIVAGDARAYSVRVILNGCTSEVSNNYNVGITPKPAQPVISITAGNNPYCQGTQTVTLTSSNADGNVWSNGATTQSITISAGSGSYFVNKFVGLCHSDTSNVINITAINCGNAFIGNTDSDWNLASNWSNNTVPTASDSVNIFSFTPNMPDVAGGTSIGSIHIHPGATLTIHGEGNNFKIARHLNNEGTIEGTNISGVEFNGGGTSVIMGDNTNLTVLKLSNNTTVRMEGNVSASSVIDIEEGSQLDANHKTLTFSARGFRQSGMKNVNADVLVNAENTVAETRFDYTRVANPVTYGNWYFVAPSVTDQTVSAWEGNGNNYVPGTFSTNPGEKPSLWLYDPFDNSNPDNNGFIKAGSASQAAPVGTGARVWFSAEFMRAGGLTAQTGTPYLGNFSWSGLKYCNTGSCAFNAEENGFNLIGNPYMANLDWSAESGWTRTNVSDSYWIYKGDEGLYTSFVTNVGGVNGADGNITRGQSFFVKTTGDAPAMSVTPAAAGSSFSSSALMRSAATETLRMKLSGGAKTDEVLLSRNSNARTAYAGTEDASKMWNSGLNLALTAFEKQLSISSRPISAGDVQNLYVYSTLGTPVQLTLTELNGFEGLEVQFVDRTLNTSTTLVAGQSVSVESDPTGERYAIIFPSSVTGVKPNSAAALVIYPNPAENVLFMEGLSNEAARSLRLTDMLGHNMPAKLSAQAGRYSLDLSNLSAGVYTIIAEGRSYRIVKK